MQCMVAANVHRVYVTAGSGQVVGIITITDVLRVRACARTTQCHSIFFSSSRVNSSVFKLASLWDTYVV